MRARSLSSGRSTHANRGRLTSREAVRLRQHRREFLYALEHNLTILEARRRLNQLWLVEFERRQAAPRVESPVSRCGTEAPSRQDSPPNRRPYWWEDEP